MNKRMYAGTLCLILWPLTRMMSVLSQPVFRNLDRMASSFEGGYLIRAAFALVLMNSFRAVLLYNGWFLIGEGASERTHNRRIGVILPFTFIPVSYWASNYFLDRAHFGVPAVLALCSVVLIQLLCMDVVRYRYKILIRSFLIFSLQWLDLIPFLTPYGFGWGDLSIAVKDLSLLSGRGDMLGAFAGLSFVCSFCAAVLLAALFISYEKEIRNIALIHKKEKELAGMRVKQLEARLYQEMQNLVHDLKRPLTSIIGLADVLSINADGDTAKIGLTIANAAEKMNQMISEIRSPDSRHIVTLMELLNYTMSQVRPMSWGSLVHIQSDVKDSGAKLRINMIRISRVLVNLLDNAHHAVAGREMPAILLRTERRNGRIKIFVEDNGPGFMKPEDGQVSVWGGSGQGLDFARGAVDACHGSIYLENITDGGLRCILTFQEEGESE